MYETAEKIAKAVSAAGGRAYYVGGLVRDRLMGNDSKDVDIEVHGISADKLRKILEELGKPLETGACFGVFGLRGLGGDADMAGSTDTDINLDIALPRTERKTGDLHTDFEVTIDPFIGTRKASSRRDFTINAMMQDVLTGEIIDHFGGQDDLANGIIRHVNSEAFPEDPLRVLRAAQFAARFDFKVADETMKLCRGIDLSTLSSERVEWEMQKALLKGKRPSVFFEVLRDKQNLHTWFPELAALEGAAWRHAMSALDEAAELRGRKGECSDSAPDPYPLMLAALLKDVPGADEFLERIVHRKKDRKQAVNQMRQETGGQSNVDNFRIIK